MKWEEAAALANSNSGTGGKFLRLGPGDSVKGVPGTANVEIRETVWTGQQSEDYDAKNPAHSGLRPSQKFAINWWNYDSREMQIWEMSKTTFVGLLAAVKKDGKGNVFKIKRIGEGKQTVYDCEAIAPLHGDDLKTVKTAFEVDSYDLAQELKPQAGLKPASGGAYDDDDIPF